MSYEGPGTYYVCGCWKGGDPNDHPVRCQTHDRVWKVRYFKRGTYSRVMEGAIIEEVRNAEDEAI